MGKWVEMRQSHHLLEEACLTPSPAAGACAGGTPAGLPRSLAQGCESRVPQAAPPTPGLSQTLGAAAHPPPAQPYPLPPECPLCQPLVLRVSALPGSEVMASHLAHWTPFPRPPVLVSRPPPPARRVLLQLKCFSSSQYPLR